MLFLLKASLAEAFRVMLQTVLCALSQSIFGLGLDSDLN